MIKANSTFWNVGQGLFYSTIINDEQHQISLVYDCGTQSPGGDVLIEQTCEHFIRTLEGRMAHPYNGKPILDFLVISHFHKDHISGISNLLKSVQVKRIILPFLYYEERIAIAFIDGVQTDDPLFAFYQDPIQYLQNPNYGNPAVYQVKPFNNRQRTNRQYDGDVSPVSGEDGVFTTYGEKENNARVNSYLGKLEFRGNTIAWQFCFYNDQDDDRQSKIMKSLRVELLGLSNDVQETIDYLRVFSDDRKLSRLKRICNSAKNGVNQSSLILYHCPIGDRSVCMQQSNYYQCELCTNNYYCYPLRSCYVSSVFGTLLTGDINLCKLEKNGAQFRDFINRNASQYGIGVIQLPHHGSHLNTDINLVKVICQNDVACVCSYGRRNTYHHPDVYMLSKLEREGFARIEHVTEDKAWSYELQLE